MMGLGGRALRELGCTEDDAADAAEHEDEGDAPCDVGDGDLLLGGGELVGELAGGEGDGEEVLFRERGHLVSMLCVGYVGHINSWCWTIHTSASHVQPNQNQQNVHIHRGSHGGH